MRRRSSALGGLAGLAAVVVLAACSEDGERSATPSTAPVGPVSTAVATAANASDRSWQKLVDEFAAESPGVPGVALAVVAPGIDVAVAAGTGAPEPERPLTPDQPFRVASNTKTFTAAATLRLVEQGAIGLDDPIAGLIDSALAGLLDGDGYDTGAITVRQLLLHTSGIYDYASDVDYQTVVLGDITQRWERIDQVRFAVDRGDPLGEPGGQFASSDTGYVLLGDLIERATGDSLAAAYRELLRFDDLGLDETWLETAEPVPDGVADRAHQYYEDLDTYDADPSFDLYGGGGLVSTVDDLAAFYRALLSGEVFQDPATLEAMTTVPQAGAEAGAAMGLFRFDDPELGPCWSHSGFWGSVVISCPEHDVTMALSVFQASPDPPFEGDALLRRVVELATAG